MTSEGSAAATAAAGVVEEAAKSGGAAGGGIADVLRSITVSAGNNSKVSEHLNNSQSGTWRTLSFNGVSSRENLEVFLGSGEEQRAEMPFVSRSANTRC